MGKYALPGSGIGYEGARRLVEACRAAGLKTAVASSADLVKVRCCGRLGEAGTLSLLDSRVERGAGGVGEAGHDEAGGLPLECSTWLMLGGCMAAPMWTGLAAETACHHHHPDSRTHFRSPCPPTWLEQVHASLRAADIPLDLFDAIVSADAFERLKPAPDIFLAAAAQLGVAPAHCAVIEDAVAGVRAARAAGGQGG